ncbi:hypothetical protein BDV29DRAFT_153866 [Aspergillus leporis]|uniref:Uncharacterized protein n=1 Tax=Aspergillus leporis TaxID=41062 RepID=A0A5N5XB10_9EURO|nr:hypothetical protein BDV29DRAFT_153866 [Aspergillus leporis]
MTAGDGYLSVVHVASGLSSCGNWGPADENTTRSAHPVSLIASLPDALMLYGMAVLDPATKSGPRAKGNSSNPRLLLADSTWVIIYSVDTHAPNKSASIWYANPKLLAPTANFTFPTGLNGLQLPPVRMPNYTSLDDFPLEVDGAAYLSTSTDDYVVRVTPDEEETVVMHVVTLWVLE